MALVHYNGLNIYRAEGIKFMPGVNQPDDAKLLAAGRNKLLVERFRQRKLTFVNGQSWDDFVASFERKADEPAAPPPQAGGGGQPDSEIGKLNVKDAGELIAQTSDAELLAKWAAEDTRKGVQDAITKRLADLDPTKKDEQ